jgi:hypothetical protein
MASRHELTEIHRRFCSKSAASNLLDSLISTLGYQDPERRCEALTMAMNLAELTAAS